MRGLVDQFGNRLSSPPRRPRRSWRDLLARYDAAVTSDENVRHWSMSDGLSADAANSPEVRRKLRNRSRYEAANNSYCRGMVDTLANDVIGTGPRPQVLSGDADVDQVIEREFMRWARAVKLAKKLRTMRKARAVDGEAFGIFTTNHRLRTPVQLDLRLVEADQVTTPNLSGLERNAVDGIRFDEDGNPTQYDVLRQHPGDGASLSDYLAPEVVPAEQMIHLFREDRPGQHRGIPETTPALPLFSQLRRYTLAVLAAAETAADFAAVVESLRPDGGIGLNPDDSEGVAAEPFDVFDLAQRMVTVLPEGAKLNQIHAEQPATTYGEFKREILAEAFAAICMPYNVGGHDSSEFNYASGKLDRLTYARMIGIEQADLDVDALSRIFYAWLDEAMLIPGYLPLDGAPPIALWSVAWYFDGLDDIDPAKAATAKQTNLQSGMTTHVIEYAKAGLEAEAEWRKQASLLGMTFEEFRRRMTLKMLGAPTQPAQQNADEEETADAAKAA